MVGEYEWRERGIASEDREGVGEREILHDCVSFSYCITTIGIKVS